MHNADGNQQQHVSARGDRHSIVYAWPRPEAANQAATCNNERVEQATLKAPPEGNPHQRRYMPSLTGQSSKGGHPMGDC